MPVLDLDQLARLLKSCAGNTFENRRDTAIIRLFLDTGMRAGELAGLTLDDVDREQSMAFVMGKGGRGRACPFGARTADALRRYCGSDSGIRWPRTARRCGSARRAG